MTKREARKRVLKGLAVSLEADISNTECWLYNDGDINDEDRRRIVEAASEIVDELSRRGGQPA